MSGANASPTRSATARSLKEGAAISEMRFLRNLTLVSLCAVVLARAQAPPSAKIVQINLADIVHPVSAAYVKDGLNHAKDIGARAVILRLDTPGGLVDSMREIVEAILSSPVPVITWVGPNGARSIGGVLHSFGRRRRCHGAGNEQRRRASGDVHRSKN